MIAFMGEKLQAIIVQNRAGWRKPNVNWLLVNEEEMRISDRQSIVQEIIYCIYLLHFFFE